MHTSLHAHHQYESVPKRRQIVVCSLQIAEEGFLESPADAEIDIGEAKVSRLVIEAGIAAIDQPAK